VARAAELLRMRSTCRNGEGRDQQSSTHCFSLQSEDVYQPSSLVLLRHVYLISLFFPSTHTQALRLGSDFRPPVPQAAGRDRDRDRDCRGIQNSRSSGSLKLNLSRGTAEMGQRRTLPPSTSSSSLLSLTQGQSTSDPSSTFKIQFR
jgi:hypothetical protein